MVMRVARKCSRTVCWMKLSVSWLQSTGVCEPLHLHTLGRHAPHRQPCHVLDGSRALVHEQHTRLQQQCARQAQQLALPNTEVAAALLDFTVQAAGLLHCLPHAHQVNSALDLGDTIWALAGKLLEGVTGAGRKTRGKSATRPHMATRCARTDCPSLCHWPTTGLAE